MQASVENEMVIAAAKAVAVVEGERSARILKRVLRGGAPARTAILSQGQALMRAFQTAFQEVRDA
jgi:anthranilate phosphoribosyltransferase